MAHIRDSRFELLRIVAIFGVLLHHLVIYGASFCGYKETTPLSSGYVGPIINTMCVTGVNLFILISGYFGIKRIISPILRLVIDCTLCGIICFVFGKYCIGLDLNVSHLLVAINIRSYWFVEHFILLIILSPIIERSLKDINARSLSIYVILIALINVGYGFVVGGLDNQVGYDVINFVNIYYIGRLVRLVQNHKYYQKTRRWSFPIWIFMVLLVSLGFMVLHKCGHPIVGLKYWAYNSPWVIIMAVLLFSCFTSINVQSNRINYVAKSVLGIYLLQTCPITSGYLYDISKDWYMEYGYSAIVILAFITFVTCAFFANIEVEFREKIMKMLRLEHIKP